jgi:hypothetical protein
MLLWPVPAHSAESGQPESTQSSVALPAPEPDLLSIYATLGLGGGSVGLTTRGLATVAYGGWFVGLTGAVSDELSFGGPSPIQSQEDMGFVGGLHLRGNFYVAALGAGLAYVHSVKRGSYLRTEDSEWGSGEVYEKIDEGTVGVPMLAHAAVYLGPVGLGAMAFANWNMTLPSVGAALTLNVGML